MAASIITIITAVIASQAVFGFIQFLITRRDTKKNVYGKLMLLEKDVLRTQLLLLILMKPLMKPGEQQEILTIAEHYFAELKGDWYMTSIFNKWLLNSDIASPDWFNSKE